MSQDKNKEYKEIGEKLKILLKLDKNPVAIKLFESIDEVDKILPKHEDKARHCQMVYEAASEGSSFYATLDEQECLVGASVLGLSDNKVKVASIETPMKAIAYAPLQKANFDVDVIILYTTVMQAFDFTTIYRQATKKRFEADFAATQALCSEAVVIPYQNKKPNMSLGCKGSRSYTGFKPDEVVIALTVEDAEEIMNYI